MLLSARRALAASTANAFQCIPKSASGSTSGFRSLRTGGHSHSDESVLLALTGDTIPAQAQGPILYNYSIFRPSRFSVGPIHSIFQRCDNQEQSTFPRQAWRSCPKQGTHQDTLESSVSARDSCWKQGLTTALQLETKTNQKNQNCHLNFQEGHGALAGLDDLGVFSSLNDSMIKPRDPRPS